MKNQTKTFTKKTELVFTTIEIEKKYYPFKGFRYTAIFSSGISKSNLKENKLMSFNFDHLLDICSKFLDCEIDERHYIIK